MTDPRAPARFAEKWKLDPEDTKAAWEYNKLADVAYAPIGELDTAEVDRCEKIWRAHWADAEERATEDIRRCYQEFRGELG